MSSPRQVGKSGFLAKTLCNDPASRLSVVMMPLSCAPVMVADSEPCSLFARSEAAAKFSVLLLPLQ